VQIFKLKKINNETFILIKLIIESLILATIRSQNGIALALASSSITTTLLKGGTGVFVLRLWGGGGETNFSLIQT
jgi:hypothetical protein